MTIEALLESLAADAGYGPREPVPPSELARLTLPDGRPLPAGLRQWLAFDRNWPSLLAALRSEQAIVDRAGLVAAPIAEVLRSAFVEDVADEVDDDVLEYLEEHVVELAQRFPGHAVRLFPQDLPDRFAWFGAPDGVMVLVRDDDELDIESSFDDFARRAYEGR